jgi:hypothetical protein
MHKIPQRTFKKFYEEFQKHPVSFSKNAKNHMKNFQDAKHPIRNFQKCTRCFCHMLSAFS